MAHGDYEVLDSDLHVIEPADPSRGLTEFDLVIRGGTVVDGSGGPPLPSTLHGVTTVVAGNCAVGFAPCRPEQRE